MSDPGPESRRGRLLVAAPAMEDPNFRRAVVLMLEHSPEGALGLVLNRPTPLVAREALPRGLAEALPPAERVYEGGPVQPEAVIVLADFTDPSRAASIAFDNVGVVDPAASGRDPGRRGALDPGLRRVRGMGRRAARAGDRRGGVDRRGVPARGRVHRRARGLWSRVLERKGGAYRLIARMPDDPTRN